MQLVAISLLEFTGERTSKRVRSEWLSNSRGSSKRETLRVQRRTRSYINHRLHETAGITKVESTFTWDWIQAK